MRAAVQGSEPVGQLPLLTLLWRQRPSHEHCLWRKILILPALESLQEPLLIECPRTSGSGHAPIGDGVVNLLPILLDCVGIPQIKHEQHVLVVTVRKERLD